MAARILAEIAGGHSLAKALPQGLKNTQADDKAMVQELVYGSLRGWPKYRAIAQLRLQKPLKSKDEDIFALIVVGLYQLSTMRIPTHAAVSETVETARKIGKPWASSLINGILRGYLREHETLKEQLSASALDAMPEWLWQALHQQWPEHAHAMIEAAQHRPPMTLRVNLSKISREQYQQTLLAAGIDSTNPAEVPSALTLKQPVDVNALPGFAEGLVSVQDASAQLAAPLLKPRANERILDACAAPGGKTCHLLETAPRSSVIAGDISKDRLERIFENTRRLGLNPEVIQFDAADPATALEAEQFDAILADVPCSATGVIRRNPDIKLLRDKDDPTSFADQQRNILLGLWPLLKPGGRLLYVTCSVLHEENDDRIAQALADLPAAKLGKLSAEHGVATRYGIQVIPTVEGGDGLYFALLEKVTQVELYS